MSEIEPPVGPPEDLASEVARLRDEVAALRALVAPLRPGVDAGHAAPPADGPTTDLGDQSDRDLDAPLGTGGPVGTGPVDPPAEPVAVDRRRLLVAATGAAAGAAAATIAGAPPAAAANGDPVVAGQTTTATATTTLKWDGATSDAILYVSDRSTSLPQRNAAIEGNASGANRWGISGYSDGTGAGGGIFVAVSPTACGLSAAAPRANAWFPPWTNAATAPPTRSDAHLTGELLTDGAGNVWMCVATGSPGQWRKIAGPATAGQLHVLTSTTRIYDSRAGEAPLGVTKGKITGGQTRDLSATVGGAVPAGASAVLVNLTVVNTSASGFLALFNGGIAWPGNSSVNWFVANSVVANLAVVSLTAAGALRAFCSGGSSTDFLLDAIGYYR